MALCLNGGMERGAIIVSDRTLFRDSSTGISSETINGADVSLMISSARFTEIIAVDFRKQKIRKFYGNRLKMNY
jgi:hypothetical protein